MAKYAANGATISIATNAVGNLVSFNISGDSADEIDVSSHASEYRDFVSGLVNTDDMTIEMVYDPSDVGQAYLRDNIGTVTTGSPGAVVITLSGPSASHVHKFNALIKSFSIDVPHDGALTASATIKRVGDETLGDS